MAKLRIKFELNPGGDGVRFRKLATITDEFEKLFRFLAADFEIQSEPSDWIARNFYNKSVGCEITLERPVSVQMVAQYNRTLESISDSSDGAAIAAGGTNDRYLLEAPLPRVSSRTLKQVVAAGKALEKDEAVRIGTFANGGDEPTWGKFTRAPAIELERRLAAPIQYVGSVQGRTATWFKASNYFDLKELISGEIVKCIYNPNLYSEVYKAFAERNAVVYVSGHVTASAAERRAIEVKVHAIKRFAKLSDDEFERFYGIDPDLKHDDSNVDIEGSDARGDA
jgi:hypothetical protein